MTRIDQVSLNRCGQKNQNQQVRSEKRKCLLLVETQWLLVVSIETANSVGTGGFIRSSGKFFFDINWYQLFFIWSWEFLVKKPNTLSSSLSEEPMAIFSLKMSGWLSRLGCVGVLITLTTGLGTNKTRWRRWVLCWGQSHVAAKNGRA